MAGGDDLSQLSDDALASRVRELMAEMGPLEEALAALRVQIQRVASEQRRRERQQHLRARQQVRLTLAQGQLPTLQQVAESLEDLVPAGSVLKDLTFFRDSGTQVGLGYATGREPTLWMTNGTETVAIQSVADLRARYTRGWDFGTSAHPGVRIHIPNSRTEKILGPSEVFVRSAS